MTRLIIFLTSNDTRSYENRSDNLTVIEDDEWLRVTNSTETDITKASFQLAGVKGWELTKPNVKESASKGLFNT